MNAYVAMSIVEFEMISEPTWVGWKTETKNIRVVINNWNQEDDDQWAIEEANGLSCLQQLSNS